MFAERLQILDFAPKKQRPAGEAGGWQRGSHRKGGFLMAIDSVSQNRVKSKRGKSPTDPRYVPFEGDITAEDRLTALRTRYFYLIAEAEGVSKEIARLGGGDVWQPKR